jgi:hypothetical protein
MLLFSSKYVKEKKAFFWQKALEINRKNRYIYISEAGMATSPPASIPDAQRPVFSNKKLDNSPEILYIKYISRGWNSNIPPCTTAGRPAPGFFF